MKRAGFTMIELIFVIVILGILAAVALPKFAGVSDQANAQKCNAFVGTLNRTIGPSMWSQSISDGNSGHVTATEISDTTIYIAAEDIPSECMGAASTFLPATSGQADTNFTGAINFGTKTYQMSVADGNITASPKWKWNH